MQTCYNLWPTQAWYLLILITLILPLVTIQSILKWHFTIVIIVYKNSLIVCSFFSSPSPHPLTISYNIWSEVAVTLEYIVTSLTLRVISRSLLQECTLLKNLWPTIIFTIAIIQYIYTNYNECAEYNIDIFFKIIPSVNDVFKVGGDACAVLPDLSLCQAGYGCVFTKDGDRPNCTSKCAEGYCKNGGHCTFNQFTKNITCR